MSTFCTNVRFIYVGVDSRLNNASYYVSSIRARKNSYKEDNTSTPQQRNQPCGFGIWMQTRCINKIFFHSPLYNGDQRNNGTTHIKHKNLEWKEWSATKILTSGNHGQARLKKKDRDHESKEVWRRKRSCASQPYTILLKRDSWMHWHKLSPISPAIWRQEGSGRHRDSADEHSH